MLGIIKRDVFTMKTKDCKVEILSKTGKNYMVRILTQPSNHSKALPVGKEIRINEFDLEVL